MKNFKKKLVRMGAALGVALLLSACGGDKLPPFKSVVSFGDSLSDAGAYKVGSIKAVGGGLFTVNGIDGEVGADPTPSYTWAQLVSKTASWRISCSARTGGFGEPIKQVPGCTNYAQGGSRVTDPKGTGNAEGAGSIKGPLTEPVTTQIANYIAAGGPVDASQLFTVQAGANDLFFQLEKIKTDATAAGSAALANSLVTQLSAGAPVALRLQAVAVIGEAIRTASAAATVTVQSLVTAATTAAVTHAQTNAYTNLALADTAALGNAASGAGATAASTYTKTTGAQAASVALTQAATELANAIKDLLGKGARFVTVLNIPDASQSPKALSTIVYNADKSVKDNSTQQVFLALTTQFNNTLKAALQSPAGDMPAGVVFVDAFAENQRQLQSPAQFGLSNVTSMACNLNLPLNVLAKAGEADSGSSLVCRPGNLNAGDVSRYLFADQVHPTPYGHKLLADHVVRALQAAGWL